MSFCKNPIFVPLDSPQNNITIDTDSLQNDDGTFTIDTSSWDDTTSFTPTFDVSPQDNWPSEYQVEQMIEIYPALKLQYEQFIKIYIL